MFKSHCNRGFQMVFANGYTISVQFGGNNYCSRKNNDEGTAYEDYGAWRSTAMEHTSIDAEVAIWNSEGVFVDRNKNILDLESYTSDDVLGYQTPDDVAKIISIVASW